MPDWRGWLSGTEWARWLGLTPRYPVPEPYQPFVGTPEYQQMWRAFQRMLEEETRRAQEVGGAQIMRQLAARGLPVTGLQAEYYNRLAEELARQRGVATERWLGEMARLEAQRRGEYEDYLRRYRAMQAEAEAMGRGRLFETIMGGLGGLLNLWAYQRMFGRLGAPPTPTPWGAPTPGYPAPPFSGVGV